MEGGGAGVELEDGREALELALEGLFLGQLLALDVPRNPQEELLGDGTLQPQPAVKVARAEEARRLRKAERRRRLVALLVVVVVLLLLASLLVVILLLVLVLVLLVLLLLLLLLLASSLAPMAYGDDSEGVKYGVGGRRSVDDSTTVECTPG